MTSLAPAALGAAEPPAGTATAITVDAGHAGAEVPAEFTGLSFEMERMLPDADGMRFFRADNHALISVFRTLGIKSLRVGGNTADRPGVPLPKTEDIDSLFAFARAAHTSVIYTLRLREGSRDDAADAARHILRHHADRLACFAIGNEPNVFAKDYAVYLAEWRRYVEAITAPGQPTGARFCGPSATPGKVSWARDFAADVAGKTPLAMITQHDYPGASARRVTDTAAARRQMLSRAWRDGYQVFHDAFAPAAAERGLPYRLEEANSFFHGGAQGASDTFASALWALDYMHWWAARGAAGINFHTGDEVAAAEQNTPCRYAAFWTSPGGYHVHPIGYALTAFAAGGHGRVVPASVSPEDDALAAYARLGAGRTLTLTLVHKTVEGAPRRVALAAGPEYTRGRVMFLRAPDDDDAATSGVTLGGAAIDDGGGWKGEWTDLDPSLTITLPPTSAAVLELRPTEEQ